MQKYIIVLLGPSCVGKSTISDVLFVKYPGIFRIKSDLIKRFIAGYSRQTHVPAVTNLSFDLAESAMKEGFSLLLETRFSLDKYQILANKYGYKIIVVNLEAPYEILEKRFLERVASHKESGATFTINTDIERFKSIYESYIAARISSTVTFDTSKISVEDIIASIDALIKKDNGFNITPSIQNHRSILGLYTIIYSLCTLHAFLNPNSRSCISGSKRTELYRGNVRIITY